MSLLGLLAIVAVVVSAFATVTFLGSGAVAQSPVDLTVTADPAGAVDVVDFDGLTYGAATAALNSAELTGSATVPVDLTGLPDLESPGAVVAIDDANFGVSLRGPTTVLGTAGQLLVTATWTDGADTDPDVAVLVRFDSVGLDVLNPSWSSIPVSFGPALVGMTDSGHSVGPNSTLGTDAFLADGLADTDDTFELADDGVNLQAVVSGGPLDDAADQLGTTASGVRLRGTLAASLGVLDGSGPTAGLDLAVDIPIETPGSFPGWVEFGSPWTVGISADSGGTFAASLTGGVVVRPDGTSPINAVGTATISTDGTSTSLSLQVDIGEIDDLFGQTWLDLTGASVVATISDAGFDGGIAASLTVGPVTGDLDLALSVGNDGVAASFDLAATGPVSADEVLAALGAPSDGVDAGLIELTLNQIAFHVDVDAPSGGQTEVTASVFGDTSLSIGGGTFDAEMLFRMMVGSGPPDLLVSARLDTPTLKELDSTIPFEWDLPDVAIIVSTTERSDAYDNLDLPTQLYFETVLCDDDGNCDDLEVVQGMQIQAIVSLPQDLIDQLATLGIDVQGPLDIDGTLPIFGGTGVSLNVSLPTIAGPADGLVKEGTASFSIAFNTTSQKVEASIEGNMVFRITRPDSASCDGSEDGTWPNGFDCYDELDLTIAAGITVSPTSGIQIELSGEIDEWDDAFGLDWLTINTFRLELTIKAGVPSGVSLDVGILGRMTFGTGTETTDLTLAVKVSITPTPPWIVVKGVTAASQDGVGVRQVAQTFDPNLDTNLLPDLSLKNLWFAFGTVNDPDLCIRQGLFISAELHLGAPTSGNNEPGCIPEVTLPDTPDALPTDACDDSNTCLAAVLIDVRTGTDPGLTAAGIIREFDIGPIHVETTTISVEVSLTKQRFFFMGGATLRDPTGISDDVWASGMLEIDISNNGGAVSLFIDASANIGGTEGLSARVTGTVAADFSQLGGLEIEAFLASLDFDLEVEFSFPALEKFGEEVVMTLEEVSQFVEETAAQVAIAIESELDVAVQGFVDLFAPTAGNDPNYQRLLAMKESLDGAGTELFEVIAEADAAIRSLPILGPPVADEFAGNAADSIEAAGGIEHVALFGAEIELYPGFYILGIEILPPYGFFWPGDCGEGRPLFGDPICDGESITVDDVIETVIKPLVESQFEQQTGLTLPPGTDPLEAIVQLDEAFTSRALTVECATMSIHYSPNGDSQDPAAMVVNAFGTEVELLETLDLDEPATRPVDPGKGLSQDAVDNILGVPPGPQFDRCETPVLPEGAGGTSLTASARVIDEGDSVSISGVAEAGFIGSAIDISWGDGTTTTVIASGPTGAWTAGRFYGDDTGPGGATDYLITAKARGAETENSTRLTVNNGAPVLFGVNLTNQVDEGETATITGQFADPGLLDGHALTIGWGDGTQTTETFNATDERAFSLSHTYRDDNPSRTPSDQVAVIIQLSDTDGGRTSAQTTITVDNVAPTDLVLASASVAGVDIERNADGQLVVGEGTTVTWSGSFREVGLDDVNALSITWGDDTPPEVVPLERDPADPTVLRFQAVHSYVDDDPTDSASDLFTVTLSATDDDTGLTIVTDQILVEDAAPVVTVEPVAATTENVAINLTATFTDIGTADTHTATIDWGDGSQPQTVAVDQGAGGGTLTADHTYGDNGTYTATVTVTDDDTLQGSDTTTVEVANTNPSLSIDSQADAIFDGVPTLIGVVNQAIGFDGSIDDPGSDDITYTWDFGDGQTDTTTDLVNPPDPDPQPSASIQPRSLLVNTSHTYARPCFNTVTLTATDDDGGAAESDHIDVLMLAEPHKWESSGFWKKQYDKKPSIDAETRACYLEIVSHGSKVFGADEAIPLDTFEQAKAILDKKPKTDTSNFDRELIIAWLNIANGALPLTTPFEFDKDEPDRTAAEVLAEAEDIRLDPNSTKKELKDAEKAVKDLKKKSKKPK